MKQLLSKCNPFYKCISLMLFSILLSFNYDPLVNVVVFIVAITCLLLFTTISYKRLLLFFCIASISAISLYMTGVFFTSGEEQIYTVSLLSEVHLTSSYNGLQMATRIYAYMGVGLLFASSTNTLDFIYSLQQQARLQSKFAYGSLAAFHLLPNIKEEFQHVRFALHARGIQGFRYFYKVLFAMLVNVIKWAQCLSIAMVSKGFDIQANRSHYKVFRITFWDILFVLVPNTILLVYLLV